MQEAFLHYLWKYKKFRLIDTKTTDGIPIVLRNAGFHNEQESGPDFFNARLKIGDQLWAGNVEIHLKASDWYAHQHETDSAYDNVILHVVWENDAEIFRKDNSPIPTLELKNLVPPETLVNYQKLFGSKNTRWINCENGFSEFDGFTLQSWLERIYVERLEEKSATILALLEKSANNWEEVLFKMLSKNFGLNINGEAFLEMANSIPFHIVQKLSHHPLQLEALLLGQSGILEAEFEEAYFLQLKNEYQFLKKKFNLNNTHSVPVKYFRLRPDNFPTIRLVQLARLYATRRQLFSDLINTHTIVGHRELFQIEISDFWQTHYTFQKESSKKRKKLSVNFMDLLIINTVIPLKFCYSKFSGKTKQDDFISTMSKIKPETNTTVAKFNKIHPKTATNAMSSQALIHLKKNYCDKNRCLQCALGLQWLQRA